MNFRFIISLKLLVRNLTFLLLNFLVMTSQVYETLKTSAVDRVVTPQEKLRYLQTKLMRNLLGLLFLRELAITPMHGYAITPKIESCYGYKTNRTYFYLSRFAANNLVDKKEEFHGKRKRNLYNVTLKGMRVLKYSYYELARLTNNKEFFASANNYGNNALNVNERTKIKKKIFSSILEILILQLLEKKPRNCYNVLTGLRKLYEPNVRTSMVYPRVYRLAEKKLIKKQWRIEEQPRNENIIDGQGNVESIIILNPGRGKRKPQNHSISVKEEYTVTELGNEELDAGQELIRRLVELPKFNLSH